MLIRLSLIINIDILPLGGVNQCWFGIIFFDATWVSITRTSHFLIPVGYGYLTVFLFPLLCGSIYHARTFIPRQDALVSIWLRM